MAPALQQYLRLGSPPLPSSPLSMPPFSLSSSSLPRLLSLAPRPPLPPVSSGPAVVARAVALNANAQTRERQRLREQFAAAYKRCCTTPMEGVSFTVEDFLNALDKYDFDIAVGTKIVGGNKSGVSVIVESLHGFIPFSQILSELLGKELPLKFMEVDEERSRLVLSNCKAMTDKRPQFGIASVVTGTVQHLKPYGAFVDVGGLTGLLHISQISHNLVPDVSTVLQPGDILKVMILSHDIQNGRVSLSTKKLEPTPGDMIHNPKLVFEKAEEMGQIFRQRIGQAEEIAHAALRAEREPLPVVTLDVVLQQVTAKGGAPLSLMRFVYMEGGKVVPTGTSSIRAAAYSWSHSMDLNVFTRSLQQLGVVYLHVNSHVGKSIQ